MTAEQPEYCDCQGFHDGSCHSRRIKTLEQICRDLDEALQNEKEYKQYSEAYKEFSDNVAAYRHLIANEIDAHRIKMLEDLLNYYMEDNK